MSQHPVWKEAVESWKQGDREWINCESEFRDDMIGAVPPVVVEHEGKSMWGCGEAYSSNSLGDEVFLFFEVNDGSDEQYCRIMSKGEARESLKPVLALYCSCCAGRCLCRQWHNQDTGHGICHRCATLLLPRTRQPMIGDDMTRCHGYKGINWSLIRSDVVGVLTPINDMKEMDRQAMRRDMEEAGAIVETYGLVEMLVCLPNPAQPAIEELIRRHYVVERMQYFPLGSDAAPANFRHDGKYQDSKGFWLQASVRHAQ